MLGAPVTITPPTGEVISTESAKSFLRVDGDDLDIEIGMIAAASVQDVEEMTGLRFLSQTVEVSADCFDELAHLKIGPIQAVASITYEDTDGVVQTLPSQSYALFGATFEQGIRPVASWPVSKRGSLTLTLDVGYGPDGTDVPNNLRFASYAVMRGKFEDTPADVTTLIVNTRFWL